MMLHFIDGFPLITTRICLTYDFNIYVMSIEQEDSSLYRGYYTVARRYEFYFRVAKQYFTNEHSE